MISKQIFFIIGTISLLFFGSCKNSKRPEIDLSAITYKDIEIKRYEDALFSIDIDSVRKGLERIRPEFGFFIVEDLDTFDIISIRNYISDPTLKQTYSDIETIFPNIRKLEYDLNKSLKYLKYHYPKINITSIYTYISGFDFEHPIKFVDSVIIIALDMYMGSDYYFYPMIGLPKYLSYSMSKEYIVKDCMEEIARSLLKENIASQTFLDKMLLEGKVLYFMDAVMPDVHDTIKVVFTESQLEWCRRNEDNMWSFFIDQGFLYNNDRNIITRFMDKGPFTPSFANESPARTGAWVGWQIVKAFMKNNPDVSLIELFDKDDAQMILNKSKYKPKKR